MSFLSRSSAANTMQWIRRQPLFLFLFASLTLGLAPFYPEPHVWQKLNMLAAGELTAPLDVFDLLMHGAPWVLLGLKLALGKAE